MKSRRFASALVFAGATLLPALALAQDAAPPPTGPAPTGAAPAATTPAATPAATTPAATTPAATGPNAAAPAPGAVHDDGDHEHVRFRFGVGVNGGYGFGGGLAGGAGGASVRLGVQINRLWGAYYQSSALIFAGVNSSVAGASTSIAVVAPQSVVASVNPVDFLEIALGPSFDAAAGGGASAGVGGSSASAFAGVYFGLQSRVALHLGSRNEVTGRRRGFGLGLEFHPTFAPDPVYFLTLGLSYEAY